MTPYEIRTKTQAVWKDFYSLSNVWKRSRVTNKVRDRLAYVLISLLFPQMYANTGLATDSARSRGRRWAKLIAKPSRWIFAAKPMPELQVPPVKQPVGVSVANSWFPLNFMDLQQGPGTEPGLVIVDQSRNTGLQMSEVQSCFSPPRKPI